MFAGINNSKEAIKTRMLKHAFNYWEIKKPEDLDPVVKLMMEALSTELYNLANDIKDTEIRLLEKIANLLAPGFLTCPSPAHAILHARSIDPITTLPETLQFYTPKDITSKEDEKNKKTTDVFFTPVDTVNIIDGDISLFAYEDTVSGYKQASDKEPKVHAQGNSRIEKNVLWLGLTINEKITSLNDLCFFFDWQHPDLQLMNFNYQLLPLCRWYINDKELKAIEGLPYVKKKDTGDGKDLSAEYDLLSQVEKDIKDYYQKKFVTISGECLSNINNFKQEWPEGFTDVFAEAELKKVNNKNTKLLWIKLVFPIALQQGSFEDLYVHMNCLPVMNRELREKKLSLKNGNNIIPLKVTGLEQFLAVRSLSDLNNQYHFTSFRNPGEDETGTYSLRTGGIERFDARNAKEFISYMLELLRSESAAFSGYNNDFIRSTLTDVGQQIESIEQNTKNLIDTTSDPSHYIIVKPYEEFAQMYAEYWITLAENGNDIGSGVALNEYKGVKVQAGSAFLVTGTYGGKMRLKPEEKVSAFRYGLMTRNRIVTKEDIRNLCYHELGTRISNITVEKGYEISAHPQQGFSKTIDITITASPEEKMSREAWQVLLDQLRSKLKSRSGISNHYRIYLSNN